MQTLVGDSVDNVPGVPGIGVKTAAKLLQEYGTLDNIVAEVQRSGVMFSRDPKGSEQGKRLIGPKTWESLRQALPLLEKSRQLVRLDVNVPLEVDWEGWRLQRWDASRLLALFREWGFRGFADQVALTVRRGTEQQDTGTAGTVPLRCQCAGVRGQRSEVRSQKSEVRGQKSEVEVRSQRSEVRSQKSEASDHHSALSTQHSALSTQHSALPEWNAVYHLVDSPEKFQEFYQQLRQQKRIAIDLETTGLDALQCDIVGYAICWQPAEAWYLAVRGPAGESVLDPEETLDALRPIFEDPGVAKINQNIKYDMLVLRANGVEMCGVVGDSMVADYLLHAGERSHGMDELALRYLNHKPIPITDLIGKNGKNQKRMDAVPPARVAEYAGEDADVAWRLCDHLEPELERTAAEGKPPLRQLYDDLEIPLIEVLAELEFNGIRLDVPFLRRLSQEMEQQLAGIEHEIHALAGHPFNIASLPQLRKVLFDELKLPAQRKTGITGEPSTDQETLEKLARLDDSRAALPRKIIEYREVAKLKGTYVDALPALVNPDTGRVHASFNQTVTSTGRLSSSDPNLQNIPIRTEQGGQIRQAFLPEEGWQLLTADYSQIELRLLAHFSGDEALRRAFAEDRDIHSSVAAQILG